MGTNERLEERAIAKQLVAAWCGPIASALLVAWIIAARHWAPVAASAEPQEVAEFMRAHQLGILFGGTLGQIAVAFMIAWMALVCWKMAQIEGAFPIWAIVQGLAAASTICFFTAAYIFWMLAAFRPDSDPRIVTALYDAGWFNFLVPWPAAGVQIITLAIVGLSDERSDPLFPAWLCRLSLVLVVLVSGATGIAFAKTGPFAYHGFLGYYLPLACFGLWADLHSFFMIRDLLRKRA